MKKKKTVTLGKKISGGFAVLIAILLVLGGGTVINLRTVQQSALQLSSEFIPEASIAADLNLAVDDVQLAIRAYALTAEQKYLDEAHGALATVHEKIGAAHALSASHPDLVKLQADLKETDRTLKDYESTIDETVTSNQRILASRAALDQAAADCTVSLEKLISVQGMRLASEIKDNIGAEKLAERQRKLTLCYSLRSHANNARIAAFRAQALRDPKTIDEGLKNFEAMDQDFRDLHDLLKVPADLVELEKITQGAHVYRENMHSVQESLIALEEIATRRTAAANAFNAASQDTMEAGLARTISASEASSARLSLVEKMLFAGVAFSVALGIATSLLIIRGANRALRNITAQLETGSEQIASAADQVAAGSQSLAQGTSEQAASLEQTSAAIEEMASMTEQNARNAQEAKSLAAGARDVADHGSASMTRMTKAMEDIKDSSGDISKIIKTIDEIAFQTNILALNAAVEAARAGEAGAGFAVVADEVRALAQRCAVAARETGGKIEQALHKSDEGVKLSNEVAQTLGQIVEYVRKVDACVAEIAQSSTEQSNGIAQVNTSVTEMDKVTQANAAAAEESAAAAQALNAQAVELRSAVTQLQALSGHTHSGVGEKNGTQASTISPGENRVGSEAGYPLETVES